MDPKLFRMYSNMLVEQETNPGDRVPDLSALPPSVRGDTKPNVRTASGYRGSAGAQSIAQASGIKDVNKIKVGQTINLPGGGTYQVQKGDTLDKIARRNPSAAPPSAPSAPAGPTATNATSLAAAQGKTPATEPTPASYPTTSATNAQSIGFTGPDTSAPQAASPSSGGSSMTDPANAAQGQTGAGSSGYTNPAGMSGIDSTLDSKPVTGPAVTSGSGAPITTGSGSTLRSRSADEIAKAGPGMMGFMEEETEESLEEELAEAFNDMLKLSGIQLNEKAVSKQQQKFMGMVHAMQKGEKVKGASPELKKVARTMGKKDAKDFASTKHKGLPKKVTEGLNLMLDEEGHTLEHIVNRFKHEAKTFLNTGIMSDKLYDALYDYYVDRGEMPYGVAKAREGDPYTWVAARFEADIDGTVDVKMPMGEVAGDDTLNELARLAGLSESRVDECGMDMNRIDSMNVSTNMSSDGTKSVTISAQGEKAEELLSMLKLAGMESHSMSKPAIVAISSDDEMMEEERETEYANTPEEEYQTVASITRQGNDLNREKKQFANMPKAGDNPMATDQMLDEELSALLDSILVKEAEPRRPKSDTGQAEVFTADLGIQPPSPDEGPVAKPKAPAAPKAPVVAPGIKR